MAILSYHVFMAVVLNWNGRDVPEELRELPEGRYVLEPVDALPPLTPDEEQGLEDAIASLKGAEGVDAETVFRRIESRLRR